MVPGDAFMNRRAAAGPP